MIKFFALIAKIFSFIPRLVVHKDEVQKICNPELFRKKNDGIDSQGDESASGTSELQVESGSIFLRGVVPDISALTSMIRQMATELPENMRTAPILLAKIAAELPSSLANISVILLDDAVLKRKGA